MKQIIALFFIVISFLSCDKESKEAEVIGKIEADFKVERFDIAFAEATSDDLPKLKETFPFMFPKKYKDSFWIQQMQDTLQLELNTETRKQFPDFNEEKKDVKRLFQHLKYYFPEFSVPRLVTTTSFVDYRNNIIITDTIALVSIDTYLGKDHRFYESIQDFIKKSFEPEAIVVDMAEKYSEFYIFQSQKRTLLDELIYAGKQLYFLDKVIPFKTDAEKIHYTQQQLDWAKENELYIWRYFIDKELLYSTDSKLPSRFINRAPFSKFYLAEIDNDSPPQLGRYIGWQIVRSYMKNNDVTFKQLLNKTSQEIFDNAKFKPRK